MSHQSPIDGVAEPVDPDPGRHAFASFWTASALSNLGDGVRLAALPLLALDLTDDARFIAGVTALSFAPWVAVGPFAGVLVDRSDRRRLIMLSQLVRCAAISVLAATVHVGVASIAMIYVTALIVGAGETIVDSAAQAAIPQLVPDQQLERANGQMTIAEQLFNHVVGIAIGAAAYALSPSLPFALNGVAFGLAAGLISTIRRPLRARPSGLGSTTVGRDLVDGFSFLLRSRFLRSLAGSVAITNLAIHMGMGVMVILVVDELGAQPETYGTVLAIGAAGGVLGSLASGRLVSWLGARQTLRLTHVPFISATLLYVLADDLWVVSAAFGLASFALVVFQIPSRAMRQRHTPDHLLGRVVAAFRMFGFGGPVVGAPIGGVVAETAGVRAAFGASLFALAIAALVAQVAAHHSATDTVDRSKEADLRRTPTAGA